MALRVIMDTIANLVDTGQLPRQRAKWLKPEPATEPWAL
jgi:hypothetical protein